ncbi:Fe2+ or Zn2+ uptake regulation protein [Neobacillus niacini]|uniref:hypothetical protein n=1 Tax=Neobacillus niacini TaxID=86668 RepID=UPI00286302E8|nr:hypothetical protein [Neobacillus niacini]MDR7075970.1 Fe2+ or Zn2+ uptake regulation protein [Neobacillus niacini]
MDEVIKGLLQNSPGLSAENILNNCQKMMNENVRTDMVNRYLRRLKSRGILINKNGRWYLR